ncbi:MAG: hypothetical protein JNK98_06530 [Chitinophagaceae bacterium]|nr:hypothetical protein [Chitinophagaceae bacterium]
MRKLSLAICLILFSLVVSAQPARTNTADSVQIRKTVTDFYNWYKVNYKKFQAFKLYASVKGNDGPPYKINWKEADRYFAFLKTSVPYLGEDFSKWLRTHFKQCDSVFKVNTEDEIPWGFDYDWYTNSQEEAQVLIDELKKAKQWAMTINGVSASVDVLGFYTDNGKKIETVVMCFKMKKEKGKWRIAEIGCPFEDTSVSPPLQ